MRFTATLFPLLLSSVVSASVIWPSTGDNQVSIADDDDLSVPGKNPLKYCSKEHGKNILQIGYVDLSPNPPEAGKDLTITAKGNLTEEVKEGAMIHLQVKYGYITLINQQVDLCEQVKEVDLKCPLKKGEMELTKTVQLPKEIPPGKYTVLADAFTKDEETVTCLTAAVQFHR